MYLAGRVFVLPVVGEACWGVAQVVEEQKDHNTAQPDIMTLDGNFDWLLESWFRRSCRRLVVGARRATYIVLVVAKQQVGGNMERRASHLEVAG